MDAKGADKKTNNGKRKLSFLSFAQRSSVDGHGSETVQALDEEMEKVFAMESIDKFDVALLGSDSESTGLDREHREPPTRYGHQDIEQHRKKSYPHPYIPLKSLHSRSMRRHLSPNREGSATSEVNPEEDGTTVTEVDASTPENAETNVESQNEDENSDEPDVNKPPPTGDTEPQVSERAAAAPSETSPLGSPRVQFQTVCKDAASGPDPGSDEERSRRRRHKNEPKRNQYYHKSRKYSLQEDPECRKRVGGGQASEMTGPLARRVSVQPDEALNLQELDIDDLESHRSDDPRGFRRHKTHNVVQINRRKELPHFELGKKRFDHSPHEVFVQLDELRGIGEEREWCETARWIKYEEDVEEGAARWGQPHVASLSFHSLLNLRRCLETGVVLFDIEEKDLPGVSYRIVEQMVTDDLILPSDRPVIMRALLLRHRHVNEHDRTFRFGSKRNYSSYTSLQSVWLEEDETTRENGESNNLNEPKQKTTSNSNLDSQNHVIDMKEELTFTSSNEDLKGKHNEYIMKRIPAGAEATVVLVGAVDFLDQPTIAFVRLAEGVPMPSITEVSIPVRFMFTLLGPRDSELDYHEIGRSISTLMSNASFHKLAYKATERRELLSAINEFLDDSIVLPPGDWERQALLPFQEIRAKSIAIKQRKVRAMEEIKKKQEVAESIGVTVKKAPLSSDDEKKPPDDDPLRRTRRPFGGLIADIKRRYPFYKSDLVEGLNSTCLAAAIFMYFAALCTAITFGGLMSDKTKNLIGISETLVSASFTGVIMALFSTQPLVIIGTTGPLLLFDQSLYTFCDNNGIDFLTTRVYVGAWMGIIALTVACVEGSVLVRLFTRFTEEIFTGLISILYIVETFIKLYNYFERNPLLPDYCFSNDTISGSTNTNHSINSGLLQRENQAGLLINQPNTALMCTMLCLGTFLGAYYLRIFRNSHYLGRSARRAFGDFGVPISIVLFVLVDYLAGVKTEKLLVPQGLTPTQGNRSWIVNPAGTDGNSVPVWIIFACCIPALLVYILVFMETQISELIIDKKERKLRKGNGYHMDIVIVCLLNVLCGMMGAPWCCAASVRSLTHVSSVTIMSRTHAPGEKPHVVEVKEQRVSALLVAILVGASVSMASLLRQVPMAVLLGVFLYMGISSTNGVQLFDRVKLFFMPVKHHGSANYVRRVQTYKMHIFTLIQIICLSVLWIVKSTPAALALPFFLILMIPLRAQMRHFFTPAELRALDSKAPDNEDEPDFYEEAPLPG